MNKLKVLSALIVLSLFSQMLHAQKVIFPRAFAFAIDDLGWNIGNDNGDVDGVIGDEYGAQQPVRPGKQPQRGFGIP